MKVLLNLLAGTTGGQITRARAFVDRFKAVMPQARLLILKDCRVLHDLIDDERQEVINVGIGGSPFKAVRRMWWENTVMPRLIRQSGADVYLTFSHYLPSVDIGIPSVVGVSNLAPFSSEAWAHESMSVKAKMALLRRTIVSSSKRADCVLALSNTCRDVLVSHGVPVQKIVVTPNGVDTYWRLPSEQTRDLALWGIRKPFLLYVSHFHRYKNHLRLVDAYRMLPAALRQGHQLVLVGKPDNPACYDEVMRHVQRSGLAGDVVLIPGLDADALRALYQATTLFVFPSLIENSPNILLEAMMAGAAVATSSLAPMPEFCEGAALYFDALDAQGMSQVLASALASPAMVAEMGARAAQQAGKFSWDAFTAQMAGHIDKVLT